MTRKNEETPRKWVESHKSVETGIKAIKGIPDHVEEYTKKGIKVSKNKMPDISKTDVKRTAKVTGLFTLACTGAGFLWIWLRNRK